MKVLVAYDSFFGNTWQIARATGGARGSQEDVATVRVAEVTPEQLTGLKLLAVGSPTRGFRPSPATKDLLKGVPANGLKGVKVAAFDTRISLSDTSSRVLRIMINWLGYAAKPTADRLMRKAGELAVPPEGFFVDGTEGPLRDGELERAAEWAMQIAATE